MITAKPENIDEYIAGFTQETQAVLEQIRQVIKKTAPDADETISYAIPAFRFSNSILVYFAGFKKHIGLYALPSGNEAFKEELKAYKVGKGSIQFPLNKPMPIDLITKIVEFRIKEISEKAKKN
jgi:uncharacterized protein YdhG (YjbR/CyaY superfamily)